MVGPTKAKPLPFSSLAIATDSALVAGTSASVCGRARGPVGAKDLKRRGFSFVGPTTAYALMQATGMVDDHVASCFRAGASDPD